MGYWMSTHLEVGFLRALLRGDHGPVVTEVAHTARPLVLLGTAAVIMLAVSAVRKGVHRVLSVELLPFPLGRVLRDVFFPGRVLRERSGEKFLTGVRPSPAAGDETGCFDEGRDSWTTTCCETADESYAVEGTETDSSCWPSLTSSFTSSLTSSGSQRSKFCLGPFSEDEMVRDKSVDYFGESAFHRELWEDFGVKSARRERCHGEEIPTQLNALSGRPHRVRPCGTRGVWKRSGRLRRSDAHSSKAASAREYCWDAALNLRLRPALCENVVAAWDNRTRREAMDLSRPRAQHASSPAYSVDIDWDGEKAILRSGSDGIVSLWNLHTYRVGGVALGGSPLCTDTLHANAASDGHYLTLKDGGQPAEESHATLLSIWDSRIPSPGQVDDVERDGFEVIVGDGCNAAAFYDLRMLRSSCPIKDLRVWSGGSEIDRRGCVGIGEDRRHGSSEEDCRGDEDSSWVIVEQELGTQGGSTSTTGFLTRCLSAVSSALAR